MMFAMSQTGGRLADDKGTLYKYPFKETLNFANVGVFKLPPETQYLEKFDKKASHYISPVKRERENACRMDLKKDQTYIIIPSCESPGQTGEVYISIYINCRLRDVEIKRVFHPDDQNTNNDSVLPYLIPEEAEKISQRAAPWKLQLVKESLQYIITDEDSPVLKKKAT